MSSSRRTMHGRRKRRPKPGSSAIPFSMGTMGKILNPASIIAEKLGAGPDTMIGKIMNPLSMFDKK